MTGTPRLQQSSRRLYSQLTLAAFLVVAGAFVASDNHERTDDPKSAETVEADQATSGLNPLEILRGEQLPPQTPGQPVEGSEVDSRIVRFLTRLQSLESEFATLQGRIDELEHLVQDEQHVNRNRFLDMDRRLREITGATLNPNDLLSEEDVTSEVGIYRRAMSFLDAENYDEARQLFTALLDTYPNGERVPDAMYWLAEIHRNIEPKNLELARQHFVQMLTLYGDHARIPEALAKLGMIYHDLGNVDRALEYLDRVVAEYPDHDAARLASTYAAELR